MALLETVMFTYGLVSECVAWQIVVLPAWPCDEVVLIFDDSLCEDSRCEDVEFECDLWTWLVLVVLLSPLDWLCEDDSLSLSSPCSSSPWLSLSSPWSSDSLSSWPTFLFSEPLLSSEPCPESSPCADWLEWLLPFPCDSLSPPARAGVAVIAAANAKAMASLRSLLTTSS